MEGPALHGGFPFAGSPSHACSKVYLSWYGGARVLATGASLSLAVAVLAMGCGRCISVCVVRGVAALVFGCERFTPVSNSVGTVSDPAELRPLFAPLIVRVSCHCEAVASILNRVPLIPIVPDPFQTSFTTLQTTLVGGLVETGGFVAFFLLSKGFETGFETLFETGLKRI